VIALNNNMKHYKIIAIIFVFSVSAFLLNSNFNKKVLVKSEGENMIENKDIKIDKVVNAEIKEGDTYGSLMDEYGVSYATSTAIYESSKDIYDLVKIRLGRFVELIYDKDSGELKELVYKVDSEDELHVKYDFNTASSSGEWISEIKPIEYQIRIRTVSGEVDTSMYQAAIDNDIDIRAIIDLADAFQWSIDFAMDPRKGDTFNFVYEERCLDGEYVMPGKIFAGKYINAGEEYAVYYFEENEENIGYFDKDGNSSQKMFLKAPVAFKYISSGYTTGNRVVMEIGLSGPHRAIDYAAPIGTPIRAVGDGTITFAGWSSVGYGYLTSVHHNSTYSTNYAHQSKIIVKVGQKVKQGETIGYVGSTGYSTGPHLHYEMVKYGEKINPLQEVLPPGKPIKEENRERFFEEIKKWQEMLK